MLFSSIVFMSRTLRGQWIHVVLVFVIKLNIASSAQQVPHENVVRFSGDFEGFLKDLGTMVYKSKKTANDAHSSHERYTTISHKNNRRSQNLYNTQKAALADVLMMKLVSYYEDKYKLTHLDATTTERITVITLPTPAAHRMYSNMIPAERAEMLDNRLHSPMVMERSRRMETDHVNMRRMMDDDNIPEVVIL